ncbi:MAG: alkaline phosphatase family protein [Gemmataceae bacterium]|nr:alkaline phosphatase family protein [Gemmataceae bacterium]
MRQRFFSTLFCVVCAWPSAGLFGQEVPAAKTPKLGILIVFDQLRGDYLNRWKDHFEPGGFLRLMEEGAWFENCHYPYSGTVTGAGHATLATGTTPSVHGIISNDWYDRKEGSGVYCVGNPRWTPIPARKELLEKDKKMGSGTPERILVPGIADALKASTGEMGKVVSLSLKDRSAVIPGGKTPNHCYWFDPQNGNFQTSTFYTSSPVRWVKEFNASGQSSRWKNSTWTRLIAEKNYPALSGPDDQAGEGNGKNQGKSFPHPFGKIEKEYFEAVYNSPFGNELLLALAKEAILSEKLGKGSQPDFLSLSFSSNDPVGHTWGPDSQEVMDTTIRTDRLLKDLLNFLDQNVGAGNYVLALSADHGVCPLPEVSKTKGIAAGRIALDKFAKEMETALQEKFGKTQASAKYVEAMADNMVYLNHKLLERKKIAREEAVDFLAAWGKKQPGIMQVITEKEIQQKDNSAAGFHNQVSLSYFPGRSGDLFFIVQPYFIPGNYLTGTTHGSPHPYDTHIPLMAFGGNVRAVKLKERVSPELAAPILAQGLGIAVPPQAKKTPPAEIWRNKGN